MARHEVPAGLFGDVAEAVARSVDGKGGAGHLRARGNEVKSFRELLEDILEITDRKRPLVPLPVFAASIIGSVASLVPLRHPPPITADQVKLLKRDNVVSDAAIKEGRTLAGIGIEPTLAEAILPTYLWRYRPEGQFTRLARSPDGIVLRFQHDRPGEPRPQVAPAGSHG